MQHRAKAPAILFSFLTATLPSLGSCGNSDQTAHTLTSDSQVEGEDLNNPTSLQVRLDKAIQEQDIEAMHEIQQEANRKVAEFTDRKIQALSLQGHALAAQENWDGALAAYEKALELCPETTEQHWQLLEFHSLSLYSLGSTNEAVQELESVLMHYHEDDDTSLDKLQRTQDRLARWKENR